MNQPTQLPPVIVTGVRIRTSSITPTGGGGGAPENPTGPVQNTDDPVNPTPEAPPSVCYRLDPTTAQELEDAIRAMASRTAAYIKALMDAYPGREFASVLYLDQSGFLRATPFVPGVGSLGAFDLQGVNPGSIVAMVHGHPEQHYVGDVLQPPHFNASFPDWDLFPGETRPDPNDGTRMVGDWITFDELTAQIAQHGGNVGLFRQYILGLGSWDSSPREWKLSEFDNLDRRTNADYGTGRPAIVLPVTVDWLECPS